MTKITIALFLILVSNINVQGQVGVQKIADHYRTARFNVAIFPETSLDMIPGKRFTPTKTEIETAEKALNSQLEELNKPLVNQHNSPIIHKKLKKFKRQYFGYINAAGQRILFINSFWHKSGHEEWLESKVSVLDGGSYYWSINFNLADNRFFDLYINGAG